MDAPLTKEERSWRQLQLMGVFERIAGLVFGKPEVFEAQGAPFSLDELIREVLTETLRERPTLPVVTGFDCGHTVPMLTVPEGVRVRLAADAEDGVEFSFLEPGCRD